MKVKLNLSNFNNDFLSDSEISNLNSTSDSLIPIGKSGIHIKKENRGKFTEYCGGKVTDACIRKAKASGNPKLVKRATFAANARKWKHLEGGRIQKMLFSGKFKTKDINGNWVYMDMNSGTTTSAGPKSGTIKTNTVNSVGGDVKTRQGRTKLALKQVTSYNNRQYKVHNYADTRTRLQLKNQDVVLDKQGEPLIVLANYTPTLEAPMLIVSPEFDALMLGRQALTSMYNATKPTTNVFATTTPEAKSTTALTLEQIEQAYNQAKQWHINRINSPGYRERALRAGFTEEEVPLLLLLLLDLINGLELKPLKNSLGQEIKANNTAAYWYYPTNYPLIDGKITQGIAFYNPNMSYDLAVSVFTHELGHGATFGLNGVKGLDRGYAEVLAEKYPLITRAVQYNKSLYPEVTEETIGKVFPQSVKEGSTAYYASPTEMLSRGYEFMRDYANNLARFRKMGLTHGTFNDALGNRFSTRLFGFSTGPKGAVNFYKNALSIGAPTALTGTYLYKQ